jgi:ribonuclease BN (tRNA processing enzyme)
MDIRILGAHNYESPTTNCVCFLIDGTLAIDAGGLTSGLSIQEQQQVEAVLLTHQHYDHIRDIPGIALNLFQHNNSINIYATQVVRDVIETHLLNGAVFPKFQEIPDGHPTLNFNLVSPLTPQRVDGHSVLAVPVNHSEPTVGYQISDEQGKTFFYTADTGPGLAECWRHVAPQLLIIEVTLPNSYEEFAIKTGHLTPVLLERELMSFRESKGYLPQVMAVHMDASLEPRIRQELALVSDRLHIAIAIAFEGMQFSV